MKNRKLKTALPSPKEKAAEVKLKPNSQAQSAAKSAKLKAQEAREQKRVDELEKQAQELMTQINSAKKIDSSPTQNAASAEPEKGEQQTKVKSQLNTQELITAASWK